MVKGQYLRVSLLPPHPKHVPFEVLHVIVTVSSSVNVPRQHYFWIAEPEPSLKGQRTPLFMHQGCLPQQLKHTQIQKSGSLTSSRDHSLPRLPLLFNCQAYFKASELLMTYKEIHRG